MHLEYGSTIALWIAPVFRCAVEIAQLIPTQAVGSFPVRLSGEVVDRRELSRCVKLEQRSATRSTAELSGAVDVFRVVEDQTSAEERVSSVSAAGGFVFDYAENIDGTTEFGVVEDQTSAEERVSSVSAAGEAV